MPMGMNMRSALPAELADPSMLGKRFAKAKERKQLWDNTYKSVYRVMAPQREVFDERSAGAKRGQQNFDSIGEETTQRLSSKLMAILTPNWRQWFKYIPGSDIPEELSLDADFLKMLDHNSRVVTSFLHHSNFSTEIHESYVDLTIGQGALLIDDIGPPDFFNFAAIPLAHVVIEEGPNGLVENTWRSRKLKYRDLMRLWPNAEFDQTTKDSINKSPNNPVTMLDAWIFDPGTGGWWYLLLGPSRSGGKFNSIPYAIFTGGQQPVPTARWMKVAGEWYGRGPGLIAEPDVRTANKVVEFTLRSAAFQIAPPLMSAGESAYNPWTYNLQPGVNIPVQSNDVQNPSLMKLDIGGDMNVSIIILEELRGKIRRIMLDTGGLPSAAIRSATEVAIENTELVEQQGASIGRVFTELLEPIVLRCTEILKKYGKLDPNIVPNGRITGIKFLSPVARIQDLEELQAFAQGMQIIGGLPLPIAASKVKLEDVPEFVFQKLGVPFKLLRGEAESQQLLQTIIEGAQQIVAQQQIEQGGGGG